LRFRPQNRARRILAIGRSHRLRQSTTLGLIADWQTAGRRGDAVRCAVDGVDRRVGFCCFSRTQYFPGATCSQCDGGAAVSRRAQARAEEMARDWINRVGLKGFEDHHPHQLSGGRRKRVALAQTSSQSEVLLMDEPFSSLDVQTAS